MIKTAGITDKLIMYFIEHGMQILAGVGILFVGYFRTRWVGNAAQRWLLKHKLEPQVRQLFTKLTRVVVFGIFAIMAIVEQFAQKGIGIPFPQREVKLIGQGKS